MTILSTFIKCILEILSTYYYILVLNNKNFLISNQNKNLKMKLLGFCCLVCTSYFIPKKYFPLNTILAFFLLFFILRFVVKTKNLYCFIQSSIFGILSFLCEFVCVLILVPITGVNDTTALSQLQNFNILILISYYSLMFLVISIIKLILNKYKNLSTMLKFIKTPDFFKFIITIIITFIPQIIMLVKNTYIFSMQFLLLNLIQILIISIYMLYTVYTYLEKEKFKEKNKELEIDNKAMISLIDGVRAVKHDFNNIFQAIHGYICIKDYDKLEKYVASVMQECNILNNITFLNKDLFDDPGIYGVVGSKHFYANSIGIIFETNITYKISKINFPKDQLCRILGIILDNAIEATSKVEEKIVKLEIYFDKRKNATVIRVSNTFNDDGNLEISKIYDKGYSSKKIKSGIGLWEVKKFINNHKHSQIFATIENEMFVQTIIIEN